MYKEHQRPRRLVTQNHHARDTTFFTDAKKEKTMLTGMPPDMKKFYLEFKKNHPGRETEYYKAFVKSKQQENQERLKEEEGKKRLSGKLTQNDSFGKNREN